MQAISPGVCERDIISLGAWPWVNVHCVSLAMLLLLPPPRDMVIYWTDASYVHFLTLFRVNTPFSFFSSSLTPFPPRARKEKGGASLANEEVADPHGGLGHWDSRLRGPEAFLLVFKMVVR